MELICKSENMLKQLSLAERFANSQAPILITGETGTGKEVMADYIHSKSSAANEPFLKINCSALPHDLIESELFGSIKGAYTGSNSNKTGLFRAAGKGTLLLDEITEMGIETQSKLLRVLQDRKVRPVGDTQTYDVTCRVIASCNIAPEEAIACHKLRSDLFFRLSVLTLCIPPLRERPDDIKSLAQYFLDKYKAQEKKENLRFDPLTLEMLTTCKWQGNVRQLENEVHRVVITADGDTIRTSDFSPVVFDMKPEDASPVFCTYDLEMRDVLVKYLTYNGWNISRTSRTLGIGRQTIYNHIKRFGIKPPARFLEKWPKVDDVEISAVE